MVSSDGYRPTSFYNTCTEYLHMGKRGKDHVKKWMDDHPQTEYSVQDVIDCCHAIDEPMAKHGGIGGKAAAIFYDCEEDL